MSIVQLQVYKFALKTNAGQSRELGRFGGYCRFVWNNGLVLQSEQRKAGEKRLGYSALCKELNGWRGAEEIGWLAGAPVHALQQSLKNLQRAYRNFFAGRAGFPPFKRKGSSGSFRYPDQGQSKPHDGNSLIFLPRIGWVRYRKSRNVEGRPKHVSVQAGENVNLLAKN